MKKTFSIPFEGGCLCGAVRYAVTAQPLAQFNCHCKTCQMSSGGPYTPVVLVSSKAFQITKGELQYYVADSIRGHPHKRGFCAACGARITGGESLKRLPWLGVTASSLDDPTPYQAQYDIFASQAQPWDPLDPSLPHHPEYPPS